MRASTRTLQPGLYSTLGPMYAGYVGVCVGFIPTLPMEVDSRKLLCKSLKRGESAQPAEAA